MSDEQLRELERRARASPHDLAAAHELVHALRRAGQRSRAFVEERALARRGDLAALRALEERVAPMPGGMTRGTRTGLADASRARIGQRTSRTVDKGGVLGASDDVLLVRDGGKRFGLDVHTFEALWQASERTEVLVLGELTVAVSGTRVSVRETATWAPRSAFDAPGEIFAFSGEGDRLVLVARTDGGERLVGHSTASERPLWSEPVAGRARDVEVAAGRVVTLGEPGLPARSTLEIRDLESGARLLGRDFDGAAPDQALLALVDPLGAVIRWQDRLIELDLDSGADRSYDASVAVQYCYWTTVRSAGERVLLARAPGELELVDRLRGRSVWRAAVGLVEAWDTVIAGDHVWFAGMNEANDTIELAAFGVRDGLCVWRERLPTAPVAPTEAFALALVPLDGAIVLTNIRPDRTEFVRIEER